ncbi:MAG: aminoacyl-tRNA hydrolase [Candidatus Berkelbacteria bacterium]
MKIIVGLGNPGKEYEKTRHNAGFMFVDQLASDLDESMTFSYKNEFDAEIAETVTDGQKLILVKPQTFMNNSGSSVKKILDYYKLDISDLIVANDDKDLVLGRYKIEAERGSAGQKGVQSIIDILGDKSFLRVRLGILGDKNENINTADYVISKFDTNEKEQFEDELTDACSELENMI